MVGGEGRRRQDDGQAHAEGDGVDDRDVRRRITAFNVCIFEGGREA
jgi:hypothetical protein